MRASGIDREDLIGHRLFESFPDDPDDPSADGVRNLSASLERVVATKAVDRMPVQRYPVRGPDNCFVERWWAPINNPILGEDGEVEFIVQHVEDVTQVVQLRDDVEGQAAQARNQQAVIDSLQTSQAALRESEARSCAALKISKLGTFEWEPASGAVVFDNRSRDIWGFEADESLTVERVFGGVHPDELARVLAASEAAVASGEHLAIDYRIILPDGRQRTISSLAGAVSRSDGATERMVGVFADFTECHQAADALHESEERIHSAANGIQTLPGTVKRTPQGNLVSIARNEKLQSGVQKRGA